MLGRPKKGFTLVELLVVIAIIGILMGLLLPAVQRARAAARKIKCANKMRNWSLAVLNYESAKGRLPGSQELMKTNSGYRPVTWMGAVLEQVERSDLAEILTAGGNPNAGQAYLDLALCPEWPNTAKDRAWNSYVANAGRNDANSKPENGLFVDLIPQKVDGYSPRGQVNTADVRDGTSHTIMLSENIQAGGFRQNNLGWNQFGAIKKHADIEEAVWPNNTLHNYGCPQNGRYYTTFVWHNNLGNTNQAKKRPINGRARQFRVGGPPNQDTARPSSFHTAGVNVFFADNSGLFLSENISYLVYQQLMTPYGSKSNSSAPVLSEGAYLR